MTMVGTTMRVVGTIAVVLAAIIWAITGEMNIVILGLALAWVVGGQLGQNIMATERRRAPSPLPQINVEEFCIKRARDRYMADDDLDAFEVQVEKILAGDHSSYMGGVPVVARSGEQTASWERYVSLSERQRAERPTFTCRRFPADVAPAPDDRPLHRPGACPECDRWRRDNPEEAGMGTRREWR